MKILFPAITGDEPEKLGVSAIQAILSIEPSSFLPHFSGGVAPGNLPVQSPLQPTGFSGDGAKFVEPNTPLSPGASSFFITSVDLPLFIRP